MLLTITKVLTRTKLSRATLYRRMEGCGFPLPVSRQGTKNLWDSDEVDLWLANQVLAKQMLGWTEEQAMRFAKARTSQLKGDRRGTEIASWMKFWRTVCRVGVAPTSAVIW